MHTQLRAESLGLRSPSITGWSELVAESLVPLYLSNGDEVKKQKYGLLVHEITLDRVLRRLDTGNCREKLRPFHCRTKPV